MTITKETTEQIRQINCWFETAVPSPKNINSTTLIGVHLEEVAESREPLRDAATNRVAEVQMNFSIELVKHARKRLTSQHDRFMFDLRPIDRKALPETHRDQILTAGGVRHRDELETEGAFQEVAHSNGSNFDAGSRPIFNESRKIMKRPNFSAPNLSKFV